VARERSGPAGSNSAATRGRRSERTTACRNRPISVVISLAALRNAARFERGRPCTTSSY
jgi:hypothetical protein